MSAILIAQDFGFLFSKCIVGDKRVMIKSVIGNSIPLQFRDLNLNPDKDEDDIIATVDGIEYFVSDLAITQSENVVHSLKPDRFDSTALKVLSRATLGVGLGSGNFAGYFVSGLPISHYDTHKESIKSMILNHNHTYSVVLNGRTSYKGSVSPVAGKFIPQPFGAGLDRILDKEGNIQDKALANKTVAVIDPGFGTTDVFVMNCLSPIEKLTFSTDTAMNHAYRLIAQELSKIGAKGVPLYKIEKIVRTRTFSYKGKAYNMGPTIDWAFSSTAEQLLGELENKWRNTHEIDEILVSGGGGIALYPYISKEFENTTLIPDSQWAVAEGYRKWGMRSWKHLLSV